jgi:hypothetical protein
MASSPLSTGFNKSWIIWEVAVPLALPVIISLVVVGMSATGPSPQPISFEAAIDLAPWTLCFFAFTLLASSMRRIWPHFSAHPTVSISMIVMMLLVALYGGMLVSWHQVPTFKPAAANYLVSGVLTILAIWRCHESSRI